MKKLFTQVGITLLLSMLICPKDLKAENGQMMFVAIMQGFDVLPPNLSDGKGLITLLFSEDRKEVFIHGAFTNLSGPAKACHIHIGSSDTTGPVVVDLSALISGNRIKGAIPLQALNVLQFAAAGQMYIDVETEAFPEGEIRGELVWMAEIILPVLASAANEIPPVSSTAGGLGTLRFSQYLTRLDYQFLPIGLSGPAIAAHIHAGSSTMNGSVIAPLNVGPFMSGTITDATMVEDILFEAVTGGAYLNVHTTANPNGEIRGQLILDNPSNASAVLNGDQEVPAVTTTARAYGYASLDYPLMDSITYAVVYSGIVPTAAHIHNGKPGVSGGVIIPLVASSTPGLYLGRAAMSNANLTAFMKDELYFNIHSAAHPGGEIRGQLQNNLLKSFAFDLCGDQEVPKKTGNGYGASFVAVNKSNTEAIYGLLVDGLSGPATAAHIHDGAFGVSGSVMVGLTTPEPLWADAIPITGVQGGKIDLDGAYVNVHTSANPSGEIRGQIRRSLSCSINTGTVESAIHDISLNNNLISDVLRLNADSDKNVNADIYVSDISGNELMHWENISLAPGSNAVSLNVGQLTSGFYLLNVVNEYNSVSSFKFVKQ
jgi:hypothetical protein